MAVNLTPSLLVCYTLRHWLWPIEVLRFFGKIFRIVSLFMYRTQHSVVPINVQFHRQAHLAVQDHHHPPSPLPPTSTEGLRRFFSLRKSEHEGDVPLTLSRRGLGWGGIRGQQRHRNHNSLIPNKVVNPHNGPSAFLVLQLCGSREMEYVGNGK